MDHETYRNFLSSQFFSLHVTDKREYISVLLAIHGSINIAPTRNCTHFLKFGFVVAAPGAGFIIIISTKGIYQIKKRKKLSFMNTKRFNTFKDGCNSVWVQFQVFPIHCWKNIMHLALKFVSYWELL